jgi:hypothetical protein
MIIDLRTYTFHPGQLTKWLPIYEREKMPLQLKHCGHLVGYFTAETGTLNQVVQLWAYKDHADRDARRAALWADPEWNESASKTLGMIQTQECKILKPTSFSPLR